LLIDGHADTLHRVWEGSPRFDQRLAATDFDLPRAHQVGLTAQFLAIAPVCGSAYREPFPRWALTILDVFHRVVQTHTDAIILGTDSRSVLDAQRDGKLAVFVTLEGGDFLDGEIGLLRMFHRLGVRLLGLTHFRRNAIADSTRQNSTGGRLTPFGVQVMSELERLGIVCDLAHISDSCFEHAIDIAQKPVVFSHGNARALCPHERNLTDDQMRRIARNGGLMGMSIVPFFIDAHVPTFGRFMDHMDHAIQTAGVEHVALGSDFDGFDDPRVPGLENILCYPRIAEALLERGYSEPDVAQVMGGNWLRVIRAVMD